MSDYQKLSKLFKEKPFLVVDSDLETASLMDDRGARQIMLQEPKKLFDAIVVMNARQALKNYLPLTRSEDREFTLVEIATITATTYARANLWVNEGILNPSIRASDGPGKHRRFSWGDSFIAGVCASLRRQGVGLDMLREVRQLLSVQLANESTTVSK